MSGRDLHPGQVWQEKKGGRRVLVYAVTALYACIRPVYGERGRRSTMLQDRFLARFEFVGYDR